jgi:hypothetical protein
VCPHDGAPVMGDPGAPAAREGPSRSDAEIVNVSNSPRKARSRSREVSDRSRSVSGRSRGAKRPGSSAQSKRSLMRVRRPASLTDPARPGSPARRVVHAGVALVRSAPDPARGPGGRVGVWWFTGRDAPSTTGENCGHLRADRNPAQVTYVPGGPVADRTTVRARDDTLRPPERRWPGTLFGHMSRQRWPMVSTLSLL